jgi:cobaltochelatase CobT
VRQRDRIAFETVTAGCLRTLAGRPELQVAFGSAGTGSAIRLPVSGNPPYLRGAADAAACEMRFGLPDQLRAARPSGKAGEIFDTLVSARSDALGAKWLLGIGANLKTYLAQASGAHAPLRYAGYTAFSGEPTQPLPASAANSLARLAQLLDQPEEFVREAAARSSDFIGCFGSEKSGSPRGDLEGSSVSTGPERLVANDVQDGKPENAGDPESSVTVVPSHAARVSLPPDLDKAYRVYTHQFDQVVEAHQLASLLELDRLRARLDAELIPYREWITRLARRLQRFIQVRQSRHWKLDQEEGQLDVSRLPRLVSDPFFDTPFRREDEGHFPGSVVSLLVDNSGSMRGKPITIAAVTADILARTLERCGVKVEVLGFTTADGKRGRPWAQWVQEGGEPGPGRLNSLRHIIYKSADTPWRRARHHLGLMLKDEILKENIDGESLWWAHQRLIARPEVRRVLVVISDGAPVDDATLQANGRAYLERNLRNVIQWIGKRSRVELVAIGIGHDVRRFYDRAIVISDANTLGEALIGALQELFD